MIRLSSRLQLISAFSLIILSGSAFFFVFGALEITGLNDKWERLYKK